MQQIVCKIVREHSNSEYPHGLNITGPEGIAEIVANIMHKEFNDCPCEIFCTFLFNSNRSIIAWEMVTKGILDSSLIHPREVFRSAIIKNAASIIIAHNHPSGKINPSQDDIMATKQLVKAGDILGIPLIDHVIVGFEEDNMIFKSIIQYNN